MPPAVEFHDVVRDYPLSWLPRRALRAVDRVSFSVEPGEVFGLLGPNRAGKTTLVKLLLSLSPPTSGTITRLGRPSADRRTLGRVGYMHENHAFPRYLNARELLWCYGAMTLIPYEALGPRVEELLTTVGLADRAGDPIWRYSKGMVQRLGLAQALLNEPDLLVLDEPTEGLDLAGRRLLREVVARLKQSGRTVLLVSHVLPEVEQLCDRVAVVKRGALAFCGPTGELTGKNGQPRSLEEALHELYES
ncbi:MAG: ABC transporter ATP-binding protein [Gemmataceae bacterium]